MKSEDFVFARRVFWWAGVYGLAVLVPMYGAELFPGKIVALPEQNHPEFFYGFLGVAVAWQVAFLILSRDVVRFRPFMIPAILEKFSFGIAAIPLYLCGRMSADLFAAGIIDLLLGAGFTVAFISTRPSGEERGRPCISPPPQRITPSLSRVKRVMT